jgi:hypothetical protein
VEAAGDPDHPLRSVDTAYTRVGVTGRHDRRAGSGPGPEVEHATRWPAALEARHERRDVIGRRTAPTPLGRRNGEEEPREEPIRDARPLAPEQRLGVPLSWSPAIVF